MLSEKCSAGSLGFSSGPIRFLFIHVNDEQKLLISRVADLPHALASAVVNADLCADVALVVNGKRVHRAAISEHRLDGVAVEVAFVVEGDDDAIHCERIQDRLESRCDLRA